MFDNIGSKVKALAVFLCWAGIAASVISAIVTWSAGSYYDSTFWPGLGILIGGALSSWIGSWALYAIGEAADNSARMLFELQQLRVSLSKESKIVEVKSTAASSASRSSSPSGLFGSSSSNRGSTKWECPHCGAINSITEVSCRDCGKYK